MLKDPKVWLLVGQNDDKVVIKIEAVSQSQYKSVNPIVKAVAPGAKLKILTPKERSELQQYISNFEAVAEEYRKLGYPYYYDEARAVNSLKNSLTFNDPVVKMAAFDVKDLESALDKRLGQAPDKTDLRAFTATLKAPGGLERLGRIIAVDLFNGNTDRFYPGPPMTIRLGSVTFNLRCLEAISKPHGTH
jgi:hypothetical protein